MKRTKLGFWSLLICVLLFLPSSLVKAEDGGMQNNAGIGFENDYTPTSSTEEPEPTPTPTPTTPTVTKPTTSNASGKIPIFPQTGEKHSMTIAGLGLVLVLLTGGYFIYRRRKQQSMK